MHGRGACVHFTLQSAHGFAIECRCAFSPLPRQIRPGGRLTARLGRCCCSDDELNQTAHSNIVWSNGALDPWSGGGHYSTEAGVTGPAVQVTFQFSALSGVQLCTRSTQRQLCAHHRMMEFGGLQLHAVWILPTIRYCNCRLNCDLVAVQKLNADGSSIALAIQLAGHHLDLYFPTAGDPQTVKDARKVEADMIKQWCQTHYDGLVGEK